MDIKLLRRVAAGEVSPEQAAALLSTPAKRGRPKKTRFGFKQPDGSTAFPEPQYRRKLSAREAAIARHYLERIDTGARPMVAMRDTLKIFSTRKARLEAASVIVHVRLLKQRRARNRELSRAVREMLESFSAVSAARRMWKRIEQERRAAMRVANIGISVAARADIGFDMGQKK